ncbi:hypothetical protein TUMSATVNIG1_27750 [Vibrio nigripulchritudo]|uniref:DUF4123 domain-containing protein n=1 Tax=Vibrio nigripulchritudo TaxID=28173 RepID=UPI001909CF0B|nr:DUF4123 domain-containing protein [Vibrio nigripulchritudo]BCL70810.1 hypothetical protein VNTUMSATTG_27470 [Vibrio nigripulchritudo]BDU32166.1 hypothetical protein TUMSATVNIG1_27750 [Vibrio nigripulchritudo]
MMNHKYILVIDELRTGYLEEVRTLNEEQWGLLYQGTHWMPQLDKSPVWVEVKPKDKLWEKWLSDDVWASSGVVFEFPVETAKQNILDTLQRNITVYSEDQRWFFFRFYSPKTISKCLPFLDEKSVSSLLGSASSLYISPPASINKKAQRLRNNTPSVNNPHLILGTNLVKEMMS